MLAGMSLSHNMDPWLSTGRQQNAERPGRYGTIAESLVETLGFGRAESAWHFKDPDISQGNCVFP